MRRRWAIGPAAAAVVCTLAVACAVAAGARTTTAARAAARASQLRLVSEPAAGSAPFTSMIAGARRSIELTMYELTDPVVERALAAAAGRGVNVRVLLNGGYYSERETTNRPARTYLTARGVHVRYSPSYFALTHQKTLTVDGHESAIMTLNFDGEYSTTRDFAILDSRPADVRAIVATFDADYAGHRTTPSAGSGDLLWSPGAAATVVSEIDSARHAIDLENEEMAYTPATDALCSAARRGVSVRIVMTYSSDWSAALSRLARCGAQVRLYHGQGYYIHAKLLVLDSRLALVSSQNLSTTSLDYNRELGIVLRSGSLVAQLAAAFDGDFSGASPG